MDEQLVQLARDLKTDDISRRTAAAEQIAQLGEQASPLAVDLVRACGDSEEAYREWVVAALEGLGPPSTGDIPQLAALLEEPCAEVAYWAATLIGRLGEQAAPATDDLAAALGDGVEMAVRQRAAWALGKIGPAAVPSLNALRRAATSNDARLARLRARRLTRLNPIDPPLILRPRFLPCRFRPNYYWPRGAKTVMLTFHPATGAAITPRAAGLAFVDPPFTYFYCKPLASFRAACTPDAP